MSGYDFQFSRFGIYLNQNNIIQQIFFNLLTLYSVIKNVFYWYSINFNFYYYFIDYILYPNTLFMKQVIFVCVVYRSSFCYSNVNVYIGMSIYHLIKKIYRLIILIIMD